MSEGRRTHCSRRLGCVGFTGDGLDLIPVDLVLRELIGLVHLILPQTLQLLRRQHRPRLLHRPGSLHCRTGCSDRPLLQPLRLWVT